MLWERSKLKHTDIANIDESTRNFRILFLKRRKKLLLLFPCIIFALLIVFPIILILIYSINYDSYSKAFQFAEDGILISFLSGIFGSTSLVILGFIIAYNVERYKKEYFNTILLLLFAVPATIVGISLIKFWNQPIFSGIIYNTFVMFIISYLARFLILTERVFVSTLKQIPIAYEEMAQLDGASRLTIFAKIIFPNIRSAIATAWIIGFIFCFGELATTIIVYPAGGATLPIRLYTIMANSPESIVHAMSMFIIVPILIAAISVNLLFKFILKMNIYSI
jgi:iron(III) transport system permease protein